MQRSMKNKIESSICSLVHKVCKSHRKTCFLPKAFLTSSLPYLPDNDIYLPIPILLVTVLLLLQQCMGTKEAFIPMHLLRKHANRNVRSIVF